MDLFEKLQENYISVESICGSIQEGVIIASSSGSFLYWNESAQYLMGSGPKDIDPSCWAREYNIYDENGTRYLTLEELPMMRALKGETFSGFRAMTKNLNFPQGVVMSINGKPIRSGDATVGGVVTFRDIAQQVRLEERIMSERFFYEEILDFMPEIVFIRDLKGELIFRNKSFVNFEHSEQLLISDSDNEILKFGLSKTFVKDISNEKFLMKRFPYRNSTGEIVGICGVAISISTDIEVSFIRSEHSKILKAMDEQIDREEILRKLLVIGKAIERMASLRKFSVERKKN